MFPLSVMDEKYVRVEGDRPFGYGIPALGRGGLLEIGSIFGFYLWKIPESFEEMQRVH